MTHLRIYALAVALLPLLVTAQPEWLNDGLVAYYPFDGDAKDYSGNGNNGRFTGPQYTSDRFGSLNQAPMLSGNRITIDNSFNFDPVGEFSICGWVSLSDNSNGGIVFSASKPQSAPCQNVIDVALAITNAKRLFSVFYVNCKENTRIDKDYSSVVSGEWFQIVFSYKNRLATVFLDGVDVGSEYYPYNVNSGNSLQISSQIDSFEGSVDDVRVYNRALSATEVAQLYEYESTPPIEQWLNDGLVAYYPFNGDALDKSESGNDGIVTNAELTHDRFGNLNAAYMFYDGASNITSSKIINIINNQPRTVSAWLFSPALQKDDTGYFLGWSIDSRKNASSFYIKAPSEKSPVFYLHTMLSSAVSSNLSKCIGEWCHLVATYENNMGRFKFYIDGKPVQTNLINTDSNKILSTAPGPLVIGNLYHGIIDDIRIYDRALSSTEVAQLHAFELELAPCEAIPTVVAGFVVGVGIVSQGAGYKNVPEIKFIGGNPAEEARGEAIIEDGRLIAINITNAGSGYQSEPTIRIESPPSQAQLGIGISKIDTIVPESERPRRAIATANVINGFLVSADLLDGGLGYEQAPIVTVVDATGTGALAAATIENGVVTSVQFVKAGIGYSDKALIQFQSPPPNPDATPRVTEVELSMQLRFPNNYYVIEASSDLVNWEQVVEPFFAAETTHTVKVAVRDDDMRYFRAIQLP